MLPGLILIVHINNYLYKSIKLGHREIITVYILTFEKDGFTTQMANSVDPDRTAPTRQWNR